MCVTKLIYIISSKYNHHILKKQIQNRFIYTKKMKLETVYLIKRLIQCGQSR